MRIERFFARKFPILLIVLSGWLAMDTAGAGGLYFAEAIRERFSPQGRLQAAGEPIVEVAVVERLYAANGYQPLWDGPGQVSELMQWIEHAREEGLDPDDYHRSVLLQLVDGRLSSPEAGIDRELLLTDALAMLAIHLRTGKTDASRLFEEWNYEMDYRGQPSAGQFLLRLRRDGVAKFLQEQLPSGEIYQSLRSALARYRAIRDRGGWKSVPAGPTLHPGDRSPRVALLRERLRVTGEYSGDVDDPWLFDELLEEAVRAFQRRHGIDQDGVVGKGTLAAMNVPLGRRIEQIRINMERLRWVFHDIPEDYYGVDLAGYTLFRDSSWRSPIQVGSAYHQTPVFHDLIRIVEINPTWTVPMSITRRELAPKLLKDPLGYLERKNMELLTPDGQPVDPGSVDWSAIQAASFPYVLRQRPGPDNALGRIKFLFPNQYAVYMHDTPAKALFQRTERAFSHGCVRVGKPLELGEQLLRPNGPEWTREHIQEIIDSGKTTRVKLAKPVPVLILYMTAVADSKVDEGRIHFRNDIYQRDPKVLEALNGPVREKGAELMEGFEKQRGEPW